MNANSQSELEGQWLQDVVPLILIQLLFAVCELEPVRAIRPCGKLVS